MCRLGGCYGDRAGCLCVFRWLMFAYVVLVLQLFKKYSPECVLFTSYMCIVGGVGLNLMHRGCILCM